MNKYQAELNFSLRNQTAQKKEPKWHNTLTYKLFEPIHSTMIYIELFILMITR